MNNKIKIIILIALITSNFVKSQDSNIKLYGFIRNEFYFNSRQSFDALGGIFSLYPKPIELNSSGVDVNQVASAEMLSVASRLGVDVIGKKVLNANSSAKIEFDFGGISANYYLIRLRQAYMKLNWEKTDLLVGQTWHPMFGNVFPTTPSLNTGAPYQPFNRSPQIRLNHRLSKNLGLQFTSIYQMQYMSQGPNGPSVSYSKNALIPELNIGLEYANNGFISGINGNMLSISPVNNVNLKSFSASAYASYKKGNFQIKAKSILGQNNSNVLNPGGYGASEFSTITYSPTEYTNFNTSTSWLNITYGTKWRTGFFMGFSQNLGINKELVVNDKKNFMVYGTGFNTTNQLILDRLYRIAPHIAYNINSFSIGLEFELNNAKYGTVDKNGLAKSTYLVENNRAVCSVSYFF